MTRIIITACLVALFAHASYQLPFYNPYLPGNGGGFFSGYGGCSILNPFCWFANIGNAIANATGGILGGFASALANAGIDAANFFVDGFFGRNEWNQIVWVKGNQQLVVPQEVYVTLGGGNQNLPRVQSAGQRLIDIKFQVPSQELTRSYELKYPNLGYF